MSIPTLERISSCQSNLFRVILLWAGSSVSFFIWFFGKFNQIFFLKLKTKIAYYLIPSQVAFGYHILIILSSVFFTDTVSDFFLSENNNEQYFF